MHEHSITTLQAHILESQTGHPHATGLFSWILSGLSISTKIIADSVTQWKGAVDSARSERV